MRKNCMIILKKSKKTNEDTNIKINVNENKINSLQERLNELNEYKNIIKL